MLKPGFLLNNNGAQKSTASTKKAAVKPLRFFLRGSKVFNNTEIGK